MFFRIADRGNQVQFLFNLLAIFKELVVDFFSCLIMREGIVDPALGHPRWLLPLKKVSVLLSSRRSCCIHCIQRLARGRSLHRVLTKKKQTKTARANTFIQWATVHDNRFITRLKVYVLAGKIKRWVILRKTCDCKDRLSFSSRTVVFKKLGKIERKLKTPKEIYFRNFMVFCWASRDVHHCHFCIFMNSKAILPIMAINIRNITQ